MSSLLIPSELIVVTGPARSGKSEWAETLARQSEKKVIYIATSQLDPTDKEWQIRIEKHQKRRPMSWEILEVPIDLTATLEKISTQDTCILVDSLGTWLANLLEQDEVTWENTQDQFLKILEKLSGIIILVAEETGWGVVPAYVMGRTFRDRLGGLVRHLGAIANSVYLVTGGYVLNLTQLGSPLESK
ncbi:MAG: bifunctional adenosylcobinamide kinase/adenosylcobinamide-phosphate guanylyltransferase [Oscillatoriales cyanobacterium CG2_30_40_61]|nr:MAG: bifunctional adenosylcobinamide kinase/adenosylcobinamide-phosphate guanylyltransferase [Oscillatoriales cyanobacterium CG2_30_40_61]